MSRTDAMSAADRRRQPRSCLLRGLGLTLAISAATWLAGPTTARALIALPLGQTDYALSNVSAVFGGTRVSFSGIFSVRGDEEWYANFNGCDPNFCGGDHVRFIQIVGNTIVDGNLAITFTSDFSSVVSTQFFGVTCTDVTGGAVVAGYALDYAFHNASAVINGIPETITGDFGFDPLTLRYNTVPTSNSPAAQAPANITTTPS